MREDGEQPATPLNSLSPRNLQYLLDVVANTPGIRGIVCLDTDYRYLYFNQNHQAGMKEAWNADIEIGRSTLDYITIQEDYERVKTNVNRALAGETVEDVQAMGFGRSSYESYYWPLRDEQDNIFGVIVITADVTERQRLQEAREKTQKELENQVAIRTRELQLANEKLHKEIAERQASEERFRNTFEQSTSTILLLDKRLHILRTNRAFTELTGYSSEEAVGQPLGAVLSVKQEDLKDFESVSPLQEGRKWKKDFIIQDKSGRSIDVSLAISGLYNSNHQLVEYIASLRDITLHRELERAQQQLMRSISHEVRTPLTNLILYIDLLKKQPHKIEYLNILSQQVDRLQSLVDGVLEITSLSLSKGAISWSSYRLPAVIKSAVSANHQLAKSRHIKFEVVSLADQLPILAGDSVRLAQAFREIIKNAICYSREGDTVSITIENQEITRYLWTTVSVKDSGSGIPADELDYIFENFYRGQEVERHNIPGAGLGLPIAQAIIKAHGGRITVESKPGKGSVFTIWLSTPQSILGTLSTS